VAGRQRRSSSEVRVEVRDMVVSRESMVWVLGARVLVRVVCSRLEWLEARLS
jgi:hypothetical protein